jgi:hypothetical protein
VAVLMSGGGAAENGEYLQSVLIMGAENDSVVPYDRQQRGYDETSVAHKRLLGIANAGHMAFTDFCTLLEDDGGLIAVAVRYGIPVPGFLERFAADGCHVNQTPPEVGWEVINGASSAVFEEILQCRAERKIFFKHINDRFACILEFTEQHRE